MAKKKTSRNAERSKSEPPFHKGNLREDAEQCHRKGCDNPRKCGHKEWIVGAFIEKGSRETELVEVKYWEYKGKKKFKPHALKTSCTLEFTLILQGKVKGEINNEPVTLCAGGKYDYVVIPPGIPNALPTELQSKPVRGLTIKAPSIRCAKHEQSKQQGDEQQSDTAFFIATPASVPNLCPEPQRVQAGTRSGLEKRS